MLRKKLRKHDSRGGGGEGELPQYMGHRWTVRIIEIRETIAGSQLNCGTLR